MTIIYPSITPTDFPPNTGFLHRVFPDRKIDIRRYVLLYKDISYDIIDPPLDCCTYYQVTVEIIMLMKRVTVCAFFLRRAAAIAYHGACQFNVMSSLATMIYNKNSIFPTRSNSLPPY